MAALASSTAARNVSRKLSPVVVRSLSLGSNIVDPFAVCTAPSRGTPKLALSVVASAPDAYLCMSVASVRASPVLSIARALSALVGAVVMVAMAVVESL